MLQSKFNYSQRLLKVLSLVLLLGSASVGCDDAPPEVKAPQSKLTSSATRKLQLGDLKGALKDYNQAIATTPSDPDTYVNRGIVQDELGQHQAAIADYTKAITLKPDHHLAYYNRANAEAQLKQYPKAIADYDKVLELEPEYAYAYANRGSVHLKAGQKTEAIGDFNKASEIFSGKNDQKNVDRVQRLLSKLSTATVPDQK
jgi:tetratricopeptide (TPR) repeat protein